MRERSWIFFGMSILSYCICLFLSWNQNAAKNLVAIGLIVFTLSALKLLLDLLDKKKIVGQLALTISLVLLAWRFQADMMPAGSVILTILCYELIGSRYYYPLMAIAILAALITDASTSVLFLTALFIMIMLMVIYLTDRLDAMRTSIDDKSSEITDLNKNLQNQRQAARSIEEYAKMKERNRIASRIHDKLGHGISGSILLLEGSLMVMDNDPAKAKETIHNAADNLRSGVDEIREALREERSPREEIGIGEIKSELTRLNNNHNHIETSLDTEGQLEHISPTIWYCINENMKEAITNMLLHSSATKFEVYIGNQNKLLRVEIRDNGKVEDFKADIGLQNMEERCAKCGGKCYFRGSESGFSIVMIFKGDVTSQ